jgi:uncharacterized protein YukE
MRLLADRYLPSPRAAVAVACIPLALAGCGAGGAGGPAGDAGLAYNYWLPRSQYGLKAQYVLLGCEAKRLQEPVKLVDEQGREVEEQYAPELNVRYALQVQESFVADPDRRFSLSPFELASWSQDRTVKLVRHDNGALKTVNSVAKDQTGTIVANVLAGVAKTLAVGALIAADERRPTEERSAKQRLCGPAGLGALAEAARLKKEIASVRAALARRPLGADSAARYEAAQKKIAANQEALAALTESGLTLTAEPADDRRPYDPKSRAWKDVQLVIAPKAAPDGINDSVSKGFLTRRGYEVASLVAGRDFRRKDQPPNARVEPVDPLQVQVFLDVAGGASPPAEETPSDDGRVLVLRPPPPAELRFCRLWCFQRGEQPGDAGATDSFPELDPGRLISRHPVQPSQLGRTVVLPLTTGVFSSRTVALELGPSGQLNELTFDSGARGVAASAALKEAATQTEEIAKQVRLNDDDAARLARLKAEHDRLKLEADIRALRRARAAEEDTADAL